jgi:hypothetical protein
MRPARKKLNARSSLKVVSCLNYLIAKQLYFDYVKGFYVYPLFYDYFNRVCFFVLEMIALFEFESCKLFKLFNCKTIIFQLCQRFLCEISFDFLSF